MGGRGKGNVPRGRILGRGERGPEEGEGREGKEQRRQEGIERY